MAPIKEVLLLAENGVIRYKKKVPEAVVGSWEHAFHLAGNGKNKLLLINKVKDEKCLPSYIGHRAIEVVYNPQHERFGNYVPTIMPKR
ncbi:erythromycin esterase family protein [Flavobacterium sp. LS1P3]|uniref:erythromycin esterase family protein n=1 Tax=Flavobacterium sp. LS1P3 TaxID=3401720 RepID=UPI003AAEEE96